LDGAIDRIHCIPMHRIVVCTLCRDIATEVNSGQRPAGLAGKTLARIPAGPARNCP
jgi:predicted metal-binding protein